MSKNKSLNVGSFHSINDKTSGMEEFEAWADEIQAQLEK